MSFKAADKGGALVVWRADLYQKEALRQLSDTSFYAKVDKDLTSTDQQIVKSTFNDLIVKQELPATATNLIITTPGTSCIYFLPKIHKPNNPGRPIVSACCCPTELISSYLDKLWHLSSDLYRHTLKTVNTRFKFFAISISWAKTNLFSLWILHLFTPSSLMANSITCTLCKMLYIGETGRRLGDRFREHLRDVEKDDKNASKPVARHFNLPNHSKQHMVVCGLSLHQGSTESRKTLCKKLYIGETGRRLGDRFREHLRDVEKDDKNASKPVARHFNLPNHSKDMVVCGLSLHQGSTESRKTLEQKFIFPSVYKPHTTHNSSICSDEGLTLETSAFESLYGGQFTLSTQLIKPNYLVILPPTQYHSFFRNLPPLFKRIKANRRVTFFGKNM